MRIFSPQPNVERARNSLPTNMTHSSRPDRDAPRPQVLEEALRLLPQAAMILESVRNDLGIITDFRWVTVNEAASALVSRGADDLVGKFLLEEMPGNRESGLFEAYRQVVESGQRHSQALRYDFDGMDSWFELTAIQIGDGFMVTFDDVTRRYRIEAERDVAFRRVEATFAEAPFPIVLLDDADLIVVSANRAAVQALGEQLSIGRPASEAFSAVRDQQRLLAALEEARDTNEPVSVGELEGPSGDDGRTRTYSVTAARIRETNLLQFIAYDVSPLVEARRIAEDANRNKARVLATLSHELRNPLAAIGTAATFLETTRPSPAPDVLDSILGVLSRQLKLSTRLLDDVSDASLIEHGKISLQCANLDLVEVVLDTAGELAHRTNKRGRIEMTCKAPTEQIVLWADRARLTQVLYNLIGNAIKYTERGRIAVEVSHQDDEAVITVADTGLGIPPEKAAEVFETFYQLSDASHRDRGGLGLGLSLVSSIVKLHGGTVGLHSDGLGHGTTFTVRLPLAAGG